VGGNITVGKTRRVNFSVPNISNNNPVWNEVVTISGVPGRLEGLYLQMSTSYTTTVKLRVTIDGKSEEATYEFFNAGSSTTHIYLGHPVGITPAIEPIYFYNQLKIEALKSINNPITCIADYALLLGTP